MIQIMKHGFVSIETIALWEIPTQQGSRVYLSGALCTRIFVHEGGNFFPPRWENKQKKQTQERLGGAGENFFQLKEHIFLPNVFGREDKRGKTRRI